MRVLLVGGPMCDPLYGRLERFDGGARGYAGGGPADRGG